MTNFITNQPTKELKTRLTELISRSGELKFLIGFFYFSGIRELYEGLKNNPRVIIKVLVGLNVDLLNFRLVEVSTSGKLSNDEHVSQFFQSIRKSINTDHFDNQEFYEQVKFFIQLIKDDRLLIRKTLEPNHAKLYLFKLEEGQIGRNQLFITGSSNLTKAGLTTQNEFNVEIGDYGFEEAEQYFDNLWKKAVKITEHENYKSRLIEIIEKNTLIKEITPFEAYCLVLKTYLDSYQHKEIGTSIIEILEKNGYKPYQYQLDAIREALAIIERNNGVLIADVVGLGKTIIACAIAKHLRERGIVICPPGIMGDVNKKAGWRKYIEQFGLYEWEVRSLGDLEGTLEFVKQHDDIKVVIVDEAHRFRNQDTEGYELLKTICRNKIVILLTATPFNNKPEDVLSLIKLIITPKKSTITLNNNLVYLFRYYDSLYKALGFIRKYHNSRDVKKKTTALDIYRSMFEEETIDLKKVKSKTNYIAKQIRNVIEPITIRRNRLDLVKNPAYRNEVMNLSKVADPIEWFYDLTPEQSAFYDKIILEYFADPDEGGKFKGAIYRPFEYEHGRLKEEETEKLSAEKQREYVTQRALFDIMRRLLVKRFESSFGAFEQSIKNFKRIHEDVLAFITKLGKGNPLKGEYILDRALLEKIYELELDEIEAHLKTYEEQIKRGEYPKRHKRYKISEFTYAKEFIEDIQNDIRLFDEILDKLSSLNLVNEDPKTARLVEKLKSILNKPVEKGEPKRKIVIFSEYADTVKYVYKELNQHYQDRVLMVTGSLPESKIEVINRNFDASYKKQQDEYDILLSTDKLSEGFNLNRAGMVINYDIPWNPVRVIQRLGRINRISKKVFDELFIVNFFPTEKGAELVKSREIAQTKMFMIHNTLGEDSKIFDIDEEPSPAALYQKINQNPEITEGESFYTRVVNLFHQIKEQYPELIRNLQDFPTRIKVSKASDENELIVFFRKNHLYVKTARNKNGGWEIIDSSLEEVLEKIQCQPVTTGLPIGEQFWEIYEKVKISLEKEPYAVKMTNIEREALTNLDYLLKYGKSEALAGNKSFLRTLREDILDYGTLSSYTLRRIANLKSSNLSIDQIIAEVERLRNELGEDYLEKEKARLKDLNKEIIIAIHNQNPMVVQKGE